jgi:hypothetical protein
MTLKHLRLLAVFLLTVVLQATVADARARMPEAAQKLPAVTSSGSITLASEQKLAQQQRRSTAPQEQPRRRSTAPAEQPRYRSTAPGSERLDRAERRQLRQERRRDLSGTERRRLKNERSQRRIERQRRLDNDRARSRDKRRRDRRRRRPNIYFDYGPYYDPFYDPFYTYPRDFGPQYYRPYYDRPQRITCSHAKQLLRNRGYRRITAYDCRGKVYGFTAWRKGKRYRLRVSARTGAILARRRY